MNKKIVICILTVLCLMLTACGKTQSTDTSQCHGSCITDPGEAYAQVIYYQKEFTYDISKNDFDYNVTLVNDVDKAHYFDLYLKTIK